MNSNPHSDNQTTSFFQRRSTRYWLALWVIIYTLILIVGIFLKKAPLLPSSNSPASYFVPSTASPSFRTTIFSNSP